MSCVAQRLRQTREFRFGFQYDKLIGLFGENVLTEFRLERCQLLIDLRETSLRLGVEARSGPDEVCVIEPG